MQVRLTVTFDQGHEVDGAAVMPLTCSARDILAWEKAGPGRAAAQVVMLSQFKLDDLYALAFATMRRQGLWSGKEADLRAHAEVDLGHTTSPETDAVETESPDEDPTPPGHSNGE